MDDTSQNGARSDDLNNQIRRSKVIYVKILIISLCFLLILIECNIMCLAKLDPGLSVRLILL